MPICKIDIKRRRYGIDSFSNPLASRLTSHKKCIPYHFIYLHGVSSINPRLPIARGTFIELYIKYTPEDQYTADERFPCMKRYIVTEGTVFFQFVFLTSQRNIGRPFIEKVYFDL